MAIGESIYGAGEQGGENRPASLTLGIVKENWNPLSPGMVKVLISTPNDGEMESDWMPVVTPYGGNGVGCFLLPEVGATVVIGYIDDNSVSPVVLGCTWLKKNQKENKLPDASANQKNNVKVFAFSNGTLLRITEDQQGDMVEIMTAKKQQVVLDDKSQTVKVISKEGDSCMELNGKTGSVTMEAKESFTVKVGGKEVLTVSKSGLKVDADQMDLNGKSLKCKASQAKLEGSTIELKAQGTLKAECSGIAQIKGSMLKLN